MNERIQKLIAQATKVIEPNDPDYRHEIFDKEKFAELVAAAEREACAKVCDGWLHPVGDRCAKAIRARGHGEAA